jgi:2-alkyl-3-oxoalkanoate reductase
MNIFVTGATGVIGRRLVPILRRTGHEVTAVARSAESRHQLERHGAATVDVNLFDSHALARAVAGHDVVINLATHIPHSSSAIFLPWAWRENDRLRRFASSAIVDACLSTGVATFIQESFAPVYPDCGDWWIDEHMPISPVRYNRTIADAEASANRFSKAGRTSLVLRFGAFYGPDAGQTKDFIEFVKKGWGPIPGSPDAYISSVSHDDAATAVATALTLPSGTYNVVDDEPVTHRVFVDSLAAALGVDRPKLPPKWMTPILGSLGELLARSLRISNGKLRQASQWAPEYPSVRDGWAAVVAELERASRPSGAMTVHKSIHR